MTTPSSPGGKVVLTVAHMAGRIDMVALPLWIGALMQQNHCSAPRIDSSKMPRMLTCCLTSLVTRRMVRQEQRTVKRQISMTTRKALVEALRVRYRAAAFSDRIKILDEFVALTCKYRKHATRVFRGEFSPATDVRLRNRD